MAYATTAELAAALGKAFTVSEEAAAQTCLDAAAFEIDQYLAAQQATPTPSDDPLANRVNLLRGVEWWKSNAAAFGVIGMDEIGTLRAPRDGFNRHRKTLVPLRQRFGVA